MANSTHQSHFYEDLGIRIKTTDEPVNEVKKVGVLIDRGSALQVRPGDQLLVYISMGGFEK